MPKSGSTFLSNAIGRVPGFRKTSLVRHFGRTEQEIDPNLTLRKQRHNFVAQHHVKYNDNTADVMRTFSLTPVVLVRNIFDCVASIRDHLRHESVYSPTAFFTEDHKYLPDPELETLIVALAVPWYIHFFASWTECPEALWVTYEEMVGDEASTVERILRHSGSNLDRKTIAKSIQGGDPAADRLNVGGSGRGKSLMTENVDTIDRYANFYPDIDFSRIGITR